MKAHTFEVRGGREVDLFGKPTWPNRLEIRMRKKDAWKIAHSLLDQLEDDRINVIIDLVGKIEMSGTAEG